MAKKRHSFCNARTLIRRWPGMCAAAHYAVHRWIEDEDIAATRGLPALPNFRQACHCENATVILPRLLEYGCPPELARFLLQVRDLSAQALGDLGARPLVLTRRLAYLPPPHALELVANLDCQSEASLLALSGAPLSYLPDDSFADTPADGSATPEQLSQLRETVDAVQALVDQVADKKGGKVTLSEAEAATLRRLDRIGTDAPYQRAGYRFELEELIQTRRQALGTIVWEHEPDAEPQPYRGSWGRGANETYDDRFADNWIVATAAAYLVGICRGALSEWIGRCLNCRALWAEKPRAGNPGEYCPRCRQSDQSKATRKLQWRDDKAYVEWAGELIALDTKDRRRLKRIADVNIHHGVFTQELYPDLRLKVVGRYTLDWIPYGLRGISE